MRWKSGKVRSGRRSRQGHPLDETAAFSAEEKIGIVLKGLRGKDSITELRRCKGTAQRLHYSWSNNFLEVGKRRRAGNTAREVSNGKVKKQRREVHDLHEVVVEESLKVLQTAPRIHRLSLMSWLTLRLIIREQI